MDADALGLDAFWRLVDTFGGGGVTTFEREGPHLSPCTFGIEIEVPWRLYFPELWKKHFRSGQKKYAAFTREEQIAVTEECGVLENVLLPRLEKTIACGIPRGSDTYWEFAFPPVASVEVLVNIASVLEYAKLLPFGEPISLQVTVGGIRVTSQAYTALLVLEALYGSERRIREALNARIPQAWGRKGRAGLIQKQSTDLLLGKAIGVEFRSLELPGNPFGLYILLKDVERVASWLWQEQSGLRVPLWDAIVQALDEVLIGHGLPLANWGIPQQNRPIWEKFVKHFPMIQREVRGMFARI